MGMAIRMAIGAFITGMAVTITAALTTVTIAPIIDMRRIADIGSHQVFIVNDSALTRQSLKTPKAAAIAGILFSVLLAAIFWLLRVSVPADPLEPGQWLATSSYPVTLALNLVPFSGIAFLWFIGALRDRLGLMEDRFFATVFFGSALLFLAMLFVAAATIGAIILTFANAPNEMLNSTTFRFGRAVAYNVVNIYAIKMAGVFMFSTSTVALYTGLTPRWIAVLGFVLAGILLVGSYYISWSFLVMPVWVLVISVCILFDVFCAPEAGGLERPSQSRAAPPSPGQAA
jgi:hypothetical protein